jgi:hypothetical protein
MIGRFAGEGKRGVSKECVRIVKNRTKKIPLKNNLQKAHEEAPFWD